MTETLRGTPPATAGPLNPRRRRTWLFAVVLAAVALLAVVGITVFGGSSSSSTSALSNEQLASMRQACQEWTSSAPSLGSASASASCTTMADWMNQRLGNGRMTGSMMWGTAAAMGVTCRQWMGTSSRSTISGTASPAWCDEMVRWMEQHVGDWGNWMMNGNMMGR